MPVSEVSRPSLLISLGILGVSGYVPPDPMVLCDTIWKRMYFI